MSAISCHIDLPKSVQRSSCGYELGSEESVGAALGDELCTADLEELRRNLG